MQSACGLVTKFSLILKMMPFGKNTFVFREARQNEVNEKLCYTIQQDETYLNTKSIDNLKERNCCGYIEE